ncbi:hypothetical protein FKM82_004525 [Ascaphus truei]
MPAILSFSTQCAKCLKPTNQQSACSIPPNSQTQFWWPMKVPIAFTIQQWGNMGQDVATEPVLLFKLIYPTHGRGTFLWPHREAGGLWS